MFMLDRKKNVYMCELSVGGAIIYTGVLARPSRRSSTVLSLTPTPTVLCRCGTLLAKDVKAVEDSWKMHPRFVDL